MKALITTRNIVNELGEIFNSINPVTSVIDFSDVVDYYLDIYYCGTIEGFLIKDPLDELCTSLSLPTEVSDSIKSHLTIRIRTLMGNALSTLSLDETMDYVLNPLVGVDATVYDKIIETIKVRDYMLLPQGDLI